MGFLKKLTGFQNSFSKNFGKDILKHPTRLLTGIDPLSTKISNTVLGRHDKPLVNMTGSPDEQYYGRAEAEGVDTADARKFHKVADTVAMTIGAQGLAGVAGRLGGAVAQTGMKAGGSGVLNAASAKIDAKGLADVAPGGSDKRSMWANLPDTTKAEVMRSGIAGAAQFFAGWSASEKAEWEADRQREMQANMNAQPGVMRYQAQQPVGLLNATTIPLGG